MSDRSTVKLEGFQQDGKEFLQFEMTLDSADVESFRRLAGISSDEPLIGGFPLSEGLLKVIMNQVQKEIEAKNLKIFLVFGE